MILVYWDIMLSHWVSGFHCFEGMGCLHLSGVRLLKVKAMLCHIPEDVVLDCAAVRTYKLVAV
jgi:hypothetical protein